MVNYAKKESILSVLASNKNYNEEIHKQFGRGATKESRLSRPVTVAGRYDDQNVERGSWFCLRRQRPNPNLRA